MKKKAFVELSLKKLYWKKAIYNFLSSSKLSSQQLHTHTRIKTIQLGLDLAWFFVSTHQSEKNLTAAFLYVDDARGEPKITHASPKLSMWKTFIHYYSSNTTKLVWKWCYQVVVIKMWSAEWKCIFLGWCIMVVTHNDAIYGWN